MSETRFAANVAVVLLAAMALGGIGRAAGGTVVYLATQESPATLELYRADLETGEVTKVNPPLVSGGGVQFDFQIDAKGRSVVYRADQDTDNVVELYRAHLKTGVVTKISGPLVSGGDVFGFQIDARGRSVAYHADQDTDGVFELYRAPWLASGPSVKLNPALAAGGDVTVFQSHPGRVLYLADQDTDEVFELFLSSLPKLAR